MSGTLRSISTILTTQAQDGQAAGSYTLARQRDLIQTLNGRTGGTFGSLVRVTDPEFNGGADPTGVADSTLAFQQAMAAGPAIVPATQPNGSVATYSISNCIVPSGATLIGFSAPSYNNLPNTAPRPIIQPFGSATVLFNTDAKGGIHFSGFMLSGNGSGTAISGGNYNLVLDSLNIFNFTQGIGAAIAGSTQTFPAACWALRTHNVNVVNCATGLGDMLDGYVEGGIFTNCGNGVSIVNGGCVFLGTKFEFCGRTINAPVSPGGAGYGAKLSGCTGVMFNGCEFTVCGNAGIQLTGTCENTTISNCKFVNNGTNVTGAGSTTLVSTSSHIEFATSRRTLVTGCMSFSYGFTNDGFVFSPAFFAFFSGTNTGVSIIGNDVSGVQGSTAGATNLAPINSATGWRGGTPPTATGTGNGVNGYIVSKNYGTTLATSDVDTR